MTAVTFCDPFSVPRLFQVSGHHWEDLAWFGDCSQHRRCNVEYNTSVSSERRRGSIPAFLSLSVVQFYY